MTVSKIKVCFVGVNSYPLFNPKIKTAFGGIEVRSYLVTKGLAQSPQLEISYVVRDHGQGKMETIQNISVFSHPAYPAKGHYPPFYIILEQVKKNIFPEGIPVQTRSFPFYRLKNKHIVTLLLFIFWVGLAVTQKIGNWLANIRPANRKIKIESYHVLKKRWAVYETIDADIYCAFGVAPISAEIAAFCHHNRKKCVLFIADEHDISPVYKPHSQEQSIYGHPAYLCFYAIDQADFIIAQTQAQADKLKKLFNREAVVISNPVDLAHHYPNTPNYEQRLSALWVGRADRFKKMPIRLIQLAVACPDIPFIMIMNPEDPIAEEEVYRACPSNVTIHQAVPYGEIEYFYSQAFVFVNTSEFEGFPNTFLQAGKYGVPILSYKVDPDGFIRQYQAGIVADGDFDKLVEGLYTIRADQQTMTYSHNIADYVKQFHALDEKVGQIKDVFLQAMD